MTCRQIDELISSHVVPAFPFEAAEHIAVCDRCARLVDALNVNQEVFVPSSSQVKRIESLLLRDLTPVRPLMSPRVSVSLFGFLFVAVVAIGAWFLGASGWGALSAGQKIAVFSGSLVCGTLLALSMVRQMVPGSNHAIPPIKLPIAVIGLLVIVTATAFQPRFETTFVSNGLMCLRIGMTYSIPAGFLSWLILRRGAMLSPKLAGATTGVFAGLIGVTVLEVYCPNLNVYHILVWHLGVLLLSALAGLIIGATVEYLASGRDVERPSSHGLSI